MKQEAVRLSLIYRLLITLAILFPLLLAILQLVINGMNLWSDPARDLLSAWDNLRKPTLIGPPSGIPGIFYGPYWIWLLSLGLLFSKNPIFVTLISATFPFFIIFPFIWFKFSSYLDRTALLAVWILFVFSSGFTYATQLWNPYPAILCEISIIYLLVTSKFGTITTIFIIKSLFTGFLIGLLLNFHISFGLGFLFGIGIFFLLNTLHMLLKTKKGQKQPAVVSRLVSVFLLATGFIIAFIPTLLFEVRHGFHQLSTLLHTFLKFGGVVSNQGMTKAVILQSFFDSFGQLLHLPTVLSTIVLLVIIVLFFYYWKTKRIFLHNTDIRMIELLLSLFTGVALIYFTARNPIWKYHFIGVDILFAVLFTFLIGKLTLIRKLVMLLAICIAIIFIYQFLGSIFHRRSYLADQEQIVTSIHIDAKQTSYTAFVYTPSLYSYEYTYLFRWLAHKDIPFDPGAQRGSPDNIYLIVPSIANPMVIDFIHNHSRDTSYKEVKKWKIGGITVLKNVKH